MQLSQQPVLWIAFALFVLASLLQSALFWNIALLPFLPFVALASLRCNRAEALWLSALSGALFDLLSADPFGIYALSSVLTSAAGYRFRYLFFQGEPLQLCCLTALYSAFFTPILVFALFLFDRRAPFGGKWSFLDLVTMPFLDAAYAFFWFACPLLFCEWARRLVLRRRRNE